MNTTPVLIIGAGIAGPATAIALTRAGYTVVVYEASDGPRDGDGAFLNLAQNGVNVLRALSIEEILEDVGFQNDQLVFMNDAGRTLATVAVGAVTLMRQR